MSGKRWTVLLVILVQLGAAASDAARVGSGRPKLVPQTGHRGAVNTVAFTPDGRSLLTGGDDGVVRIWDVVSGRIRAILPPQEGRIVQISLSPDGKRFLTLSNALGDYVSRVRLWTFDGPDEVADLGLGTDAMFSSDGKHLAMIASRLVVEPSESSPQSRGGIFSKRVVVCNALSGKVRKVLSAESDWESVCFSPDGKLLAARIKGTRGVRGGPVHLWKVGPWSKAAELPVADDPPLDPNKSFEDQRKEEEQAGPLPQSPDLALSHDGSYLISGDWRGLLRWDLRTRREDLQPVPRGQVTAAAPGGRWVAVISPRKIELIEGATFKAAGSFPGVTYSFSTAYLNTQLITFSPDGSLLATGSDAGGLIGGGVQVHALGQSDRPLWSLPLEQVRSKRFVFSRDAKLLAVLLTRDAIELRNAATGTLLRTLEPSDSNMREPAGSGERDTAQSARLEAVPGGLGVPSIANLRARTSLQNLAKSGPLAVSVDGSFAAFVEKEDGRQHVALWDLRKGLKAGAAVIQDPALLEFSPNGEWLAAITRQGLEVWRVSGVTRHFGPGDLFRDRGEAATPVRLSDWNFGAPILVFSADSSTLAYYSEEVTSEGVFHIVSLSERRQQCAIKRSIAGCYAASLASDGKTLALGANSLYVELWSAVTGQLDKKLQGPYSSGPSWYREFLCLSPDRKLVAMCRGGVEGDAELTLWNGITSKLERRLALSRLPEQMALTHEGRIAAISGGKITLWDPRTGKGTPLHDSAEISGLPYSFRAPETATDAALSLHSPIDGRALGTLYSLWSQASGDQRAAISATDWYLSTPSGYFDCSANSTASLLWNLNGTLVPAERYLRRYRRPDLVRRALAGEKLTAPPLTLNDIPPTLKFLGLKNGSVVRGDKLEVTIEASGNKPVKEVELLVNGRPLAPDEARPISLGSKGLALGSKAIALGSKPIALGSKEAGPQRFTFRFSLPKGVSEVRLRAVAYDVSDIGSDPVEIVLKREGATPVAGRLFMLAVGVSKYAHSDGKGFKNLRFPALDATAIADRFRKEGPPLYEQVNVKTLTDAQATMSNVRTELAQLQREVRPGQVDTVVLFLSGHGISRDGKYAFAPYDLDLQKLGTTSLSGTELKEALGGKLRAKSVFLFVDTCHSGGLSGRNDDLAIAVGEGVYVMASSGAKEYSYESPEWGHGAFTLALLRSLRKKPANGEGVIRFNSLLTAVPDEVAGLMKAAQRNEDDQYPCMPRITGNPRVPLVSVLQ